MPGSLAEEFGRRREREVRESSGRLPPNAKYWLPRDGRTAASAFRFLQEKCNKKEEQNLNICEQYTLHHYLKYVCTTIR